MFKPKGPRNFPQTSPPLPLIYTETGNESRLGKTWQTPTHPVPENIVFN